MVGDLTRRELAHKEKGTKRSGVAKVEDEYEAMAHEVEDTQVACRVRDQVGKNRDGTLNLIVCKRTGPEQVRSPWVRRVGSPLLQHRCTSTCWLSLSLSLSFTHRSGVYGRKWSALPNLIKVLAGMGWGRRPESPLLRYEQPVTPSRHGLKGVGRNLPCCVRRACES